MNIVRSMGWAAWPMLLCLGACTTGKDGIWMDDLDIKTYSEGIPGIAARAKASGDTMRLGGIVYERGVGVKCVSLLAFYLEGKGRRFTALAGVDDKSLNTVGVKFYVIGDKKILFESGVMHAGDEPRKVDVPLEGIARLGLLVTGDTANMSKAFPDWANARFFMENGHVPGNIPNTDKAYILTPAPGKGPHINGAAVTGATPGNPFLFTVAATGQRPMSYSSSGLPRGLTMDPATGIITGKADRKGDYAVSVTVKNAFGHDTKRLTIRIGDTIALTPPMGWNGWNSWARDIDREKVMRSARALVQRGLRDHGWTYINIDDAWQGQRSGADHALQPNGKFPRFREMVDSLHALGLKAGVYSTPWISSYAGFAGGSSDFADGAYPDSLAANKRAYRHVGEYRFEKADARQMAEWGIDFLKYDWHIDVSSAERMSEALRHSGRDIVYSLSNSAPFANAADWKRLANMWRTGPDIRDSWNSLYVSAFTIDKWGPYGGPGHWNDPDMMIVGKVTTSAVLHPTRLTPDEQYSHVSIYSLLAAPLIIGSPIEELDAFGLSLLTNDEVIAIDQDPLGRPARLLSDEEGMQTWIRPLQDGSYAVGLFNTADFGKTPVSYFRWGDEKPVKYTFDAGKAGLKGTWKIRDVWRQKDLNISDGAYTTEIPYHGVVLLRFYPLHAQETRRVWLDSLDIHYFAEGLRPVSARTSYKSAEPIRINGVAYSRGVGVQTVSGLFMYLDGHARRFTAAVGADDQANKEIPVKFYVIGDGKILFESGEMRVGDAARPVDVDLTGVRRLGLLAKDDVGGNNNKRTNADWGDAQFEMEGAYLPGHIPNEGEKYILTPPAGKKPRINSAAVFGAAPGHPFLYTIAATGQRPMRFSARGLPEGLSLDAATGIITGKVDRKGTYRVMLQAENKAGTAARELRIYIGDTLALTPPIGWNGFNCWGDSIDEEKVLASAHAMADKGLKDHGWVYVNIDDAWQGRRGGPLNALQPNEKFPAFAKMVGEIHSLGLKAGLYSTPYIASYGGYPGASSNSPTGGETHASIMVDRRAFNHIGPHRLETEDARQMAEWGIDFLKYDWRMDVNSAERMQTALKASGRDMVLSLSNTAPFEHVKDWARVSNMWRTGPDISDSWTSLYSLAFTIDKWCPYGGRGHWNDPDMMIVGKVSGAGNWLHPTRLTPDEQYSHVSLFSLLAAPMLIGCPIEQLDDFTLSLLTNDEVIAIDQDPLGKPGRLLGKDDGVEIWTRSLEDGSIAVGLFNTDHYGETPASYFHWGNEAPVKYTFDLARAGLKGRWKARDMWRQKDLGVFEKTLSTTIRHHGVSLLRLYPAERNGSSGK